MFVCEVLLMEGVAVMDYWARAAESRQQLVLFPTRLDDVVPAEHPVRLLDEILSRLDWSAWERLYHLRRGQPPFHPRVLAGVLLYGLLTRVRTSRALEDALRVRLDFRWLAEGRSIDHTTLSEFRRSHPEALKDLFVQIGLVARELGFVTLESLAYDGTRVRANSRRSGTRTVDQLRKSREELAATFTELERRLEQADALAAGDERLAADSSTLPQELQDTRQRLARIDAALEEVARVVAAGQTVPARLPLTDPQARVTPNKEGGFAPNYTPLATVDVASGLIVGCDVIAMTNEEASLVPQIEAVQRDFGLDAPVPEVLADGMMATGNNLACLHEMNVTCYSPSKQVPPDQNPAFREDLTQPVPESAWSALPSQTTQSKKSSQSLTLLTKEAFRYDARQDCYWCPQGKPLSFQTQSTEKFATGNQTRRRYRSNPADCAGCPLRGRCLNPKVTRREINRFEHDDLVEQLARRMQTPEAKAKYARRREVAERPFAHIKQQFGARQFLLRGLAQVRQEWCWLASAFNLSCLMNLIRNRAGPNAAGAALPSPMVPG